jgi:hypothetical protein
MRAAPGDRPSIAPSAVPTLTPSALKHLASTLIEASHTPARAAPAAVAPTAAIDAVAAHLPRSLQALQAGLQFDAALRSSRLSTARVQHLIEGPHDHALQRLPVALQSERIKDLLRALLTGDQYSGAEVLPEAFAALSRIGVSPARLLSIAARWVWMPGQLPLLLGADGAALHGLGPADRREVLTALAGRLALLAPKPRGLMASALWGLVTRHAGGMSAGTGALLREAILARPGDGLLPADSLEALTRFRVRVKDPERLPGPADLRPVDVPTRSAISGTTAALAHFAYWLHCRREPSLPELVAMPGPARWRVLEDYAADPLAAGSGLAAAALDPLHLEERLLQFNTALRGT